MPLSYRSLQRSIGARMFRAFGAMALLIGLVGGSAAFMLSMAGDIVADTYDRPLMAINFARAASVDFAQMDKELLRERTMPEARAQIEQHIDALDQNFSDDLAVAEQRSLSDAERDVIGQIRAVAVLWNDERRAGDGATNVAALDHLAETIIERFDVLTELTAEHSFVERRKAIWSIARFRYTTIAVALLGFFLAAAIAWRLRRRIVRPLSAAARIADRIAAGELQTPIPVGGDDETGALLRSITVMQESIRVMVEREMAEKQSAQRRLTDAVESASDGMVLVDARERIVVANTQMKKLFPALDQVSIAGSDFAAFVRIARLQMARPGEIDVFDRGGEFQLTDNRWIRVSRSATQEGGFFLLLSDFTSIKEREQRYREAQLQAEAASNAKTRFLANMSHELRTPLNAIIGFSEIIAGQILGPQAGDKYVAYAGNIVESGRNLLGVINNVLELARTETGGLALSLELVDLQEILSSCAVTMRDKCARADLRFDVALGEQPLLTNGDAGKLRQVFLNLLSNALKFTEPGGRVQLSAGSDKGEIWVEIVDTGIGMSAAEIPVALTPFEQVDTKLARRYEGTGLGLPLAKALVDLHGGTLSIVSTPGSGTTVVVRLKRAAEPRQPLRLVASN